MKVIKPTQTNTKPAIGDLFLGDNITLAPLVGLPETKDVELYIVNFGVGERNRVHIHKVDQILIATVGRGIIADENGEQIMEPGDVVTIPAGHPHWHGATADSNFSHITVARPGDVIEIVDQDARGAWGAIA